MRTVDWIELIKALTPIIIAIFQPRIKDVGMMVANSMLHAEQTGMEGKDKKEMVLNDITPLIVRSTGLTADEAREALGEGIDMAVLTANVLHQMNNTKK